MFHIMKFGLQVAFLMLAIFGPVWYYLIFVMQP